jgi:hypothetical protein
MKILYSLFFILIVLSSIQAGTRDPSIPDSEYLKFGKEFIHIVRVCGKYKDGNNFEASGVIIKPNVILTAAHIFEPYESCYIKTDNDAEVKISKVIRHKNFDMDKFGENDIAICFLDNKVELEFYPELYTDRDEVSQQCTLSGYGITGTFSTGANHYDGKKRAGANIIDELDRGLLICSPSGPGIKTKLEFITASGDSGGGLFIGNKLAGIHSVTMIAGKNPNSRYGTQSGHTRISDHVDWIKDTIK